MSLVDLMFVDKNASLSERDKERMEQRGITVVIVDGDPNRCTRRESFYRSDGNAAGTAA